MTYPIHTFVVAPGFGARELHLGQSVEDVRAIFGPPDDTTEKFKGQYFFNYRSRGIEIDFGKRGGRVVYIYFFRKGVRGHMQAHVKTESGIRLGDKRDRVLQVDGEPQERGNPILLNSGGRLGEWFSYSTGINYEFGLDERLEMITIACPKRR